MKVWRFGLVLVALLLYCGMPERGAAGMRLDLPGGPTVVWAPSESYEGKTEADPRLDRPVEFWRAGLTLIEVLWCFGISNPETTRRSRLFTARNPAFCKEEPCRAPAYLSAVKWKNVDVGPGYYYITATFTEWLPLLARDDTRQIVCEEIAAATVDCDASITAFVLMPGHLHLLVYVPARGAIGRFYKLWRGRSARRIVDHLQRANNVQFLPIMAEHANGGCRYAVWKEQVRSLPIYSERKLFQIVDYIHGNPVRKGLVSTPDQWHLSSYRWYEFGEPVEFDIVPPVVR